MEQLRLMSISQGLKQGILPNPTKAITHQQQMRVREFIEFKDTMGGLPTMNLKLFCPKQSI